MSQYDFGAIDPAVKSGQELADDLNKFRDALNSLHKGASAPNYVAAGMLWLDDSAAPTWELKMYDGTDWISLRTINTTGNTTSSSLENLTISGHLTVGNTAVRSGSGSPETAVTGSIGDLYLRTDGGAGTTLYVKESGSGNTGWVAK